MDVRIRMGSTMMVVGPSSSGKSVFIVRLIDNAMQLFDVTPTRVFWCFGHRTGDHEELATRNYTMMQGIPDNFDFIVPNSILVLDDLMLEAGNNRAVTELFTAGAHHHPCFVIFTQHNLFHKALHQRTFQLNSQYLVLFKNPRDAAQIEYLSRQMYPNSKHYLSAIFQDATLNPHTYLLIDLHAETSELVRVRARILPHEKPMIAYVNKQLYNDLLRV